MMMASLVTCLVGLSMRLLLLLLLLAAAAPPCNGSVLTAQLVPGTRGSQMNWIDNKGIHLQSNNSNFGFGFTTISASDTTSYLLAVIHMNSKTVVWAANAAAPVSHSDDFVFDEEGNAYLESGSEIVWSTNTSGKGATSMVLQDSGNLVVLGTGDGSAPPPTLWESFSYPTDTLLSGQSFKEGMSLLNQPNNKLRYRLVIEGGDMKLYADFPTPQPYWSLKKEPRKTINKEGVGAGLLSSRLSSTSWDFYDVEGAAGTPLWQFIFGGSSEDGNLTWAAVLGDDGFISFFSLPVQDQPNQSNSKIPQDPCDAPEHCDPYNVCYSERCQCPAVLGTNCNPVVASPCNSSAADFKFAKVDDGVGYFATAFVSPSAKVDLSGCQNLCINNCTCLALFHRNGSDDCYLFDQIGNLQQLDGNVTDYVGYIRLPKGEGDGNGNSGNGNGGHPIVIVVISLATAAVIVAVVYFAIRIIRRKSLPAEPSQASSDEDNFLESISSMPVRFRYRDLQDATGNFSVKLGQGGFGSVYLGKLPDGTQVAVKKLEGIGQGKKEFRAEVTIIGSIHHIHLVKLRGFCAEGTHRLLAYEYMANGSLDRWIFRNQEEFKLDWDKRYNIALGTAKGLAYLHEDCESKIIHCDIKPENVLLDDNFVAKVSDFGLAKLMTREQSHVFTTLRGTRGYLAPEWITNYAISEKSDVFSFGMVLLEIIGGRKNYDPAESSEKAHFPSYAFKKVEEGKLMEILDAKLEYNDKDERIETAIKVALWCIQEDMSLRPSMTKVVQMLEGIQYVPELPKSLMSSQVGFLMYPNSFKSISEGGTSSGPSDCNSDAFISAVRLSGPR